MKITTCLLTLGAFFSASAGGRAADLPAGISSEPLTARSGPRGATLFVEVSPEETGVITENNYADPKMWEEREKEFALGAIGTGVAVGDYDGDGRPDLFVVSKTERCRLFRNLGHWKFQDVTGQAGLGGPAGPWEQGLAWMKQSLGQAGDGASAETWKQGAAFVDVNNDGRLDLYVCRFNAPNLLYVNQGDGTFKEEGAARGLAVVDASGMAAFCDYDRDGWLDVYIHTSLLDAVGHPNGQVGRLFHNDGDGHFTEVTARAGIQGEALSHSATWWDYDNDGWPDLYVANDFAPADSLYHNNRDGTFTNTIDRVVPHMPYSSMGADQGDINNDGLIDFVVADMAATAHEKDQRGMATSRAARRDDDGRASAPQLLRNALYLNTGEGWMLEAAVLAGIEATDWTWSVRLEDLDNDGRLDLHVTNGMVREYQNADLRDRIVVAENLAESRRIMRDSPLYPESKLAFRNLGDLKFENVSAAWGLNQKDVSFGAAFADFDGDGDLDLVYSNYRHGVTLLRNDSDQGHRLMVSLHGTRSNRFGVGALVRIETASGVQVRPVVVARGYLSSSDVVVHFGLGEDTRVRRLTVAWPSGETQSFSDLAVDRHFTVTEPEAKSPGAEARRNGGGTTVKAAPQFENASGAMNFALRSTEGPPAVVRQPLIPTRFDRRGPALAVADLDGDGREDAILGGTTADAPQLILATASGKFAAGPRPLAESMVGYAGPLVCFDGNGDGANDVLLTKGRTDFPAGSAEYQPKLLLNDGHGRFEPAPAAMLPALPISAGAVAAADFDRDGQLDVFIGGRVQPGEYPLAPRSALLAKRQGKFEDVTDAIAPGLGNVGMVSSALWTDVDGDGWPDLLLALEWGGVRYWHNNAGRSFEDRTNEAGFAAAGNGWWTSLAAADFNGDGRLDYVAGNVGLNTQYHASSEHPARLFYGRFTDGGRPLVIEAYEEGARLFPWRTRKDLGAKIPSVLRKFPKNDSYARATLGRILGEERLKAATPFRATEFQSGVFLSQPDGTFRFEPLPRIAQIAPIQGMVAGDFDGDGRADIYAVQNSYAPIPVVGHFDGGASQLLRGDGHGHFTAATPSETGLIVRGDAKALVVMDLDQDGWPDFLTTRNDGSTLAYRNRGIAGRNSMFVVLRGPAGNPSGIGACVTLELADGTTEMAEVHAGSGYYSQSTAACFFGYPAGAAPRRLKVRWPDGSTTVKEGPLFTPGLVLSSPAR